MREWLGRRILQAMVIGVAGLPLVLPPLAGATRYSGHNDGSLRVLVNGSTQAIHSATLLFEPKAIACSTNGGQSNVVISVKGPVAVKHGRFRVSGEKRSGESGNISWVFQGRFKGGQGIHGSASVREQLVDAGDDAECWSGSGPKDPLIPFSAKAIKAR